MSQRRIIFRALSSLAFMTLISGCVGSGGASLAAGGNAAASEAFLSRSTMGWEKQGGPRSWTSEALTAVAENDALLSTRVPKDIDSWCPAYRKASVDQRRAFWVGLMHAVARHESTWNAKASGGGGRYIGLMQISPATARQHGCDASSAQALRDGGDNLSCAVEIFAKSVASDGMVAGNGRQGVGRDWGPFRKASKRAQMAAVTSAQPWCKG